MYIKTDEITDSLYEIIKNDKDLINALDWNKVSTSVILSLFLVTGDEKLKEILGERFCPDNVSATVLQATTKDSFKWKNKYEKAKEDLDAAISWYHRELAKKQEIIDAQNEELVNCKKQIETLSKSPQNHNRYKITKEWTVGKDSSDVTYEDLLYSTTNQKAYVKTANIKIYDDDQEIVVHILQ